ncbi:DegT/DnrJ/EryC1/StrS family aminotransferase [Aliarcobacter butzleri]|uniref:DegT/DnrJ/EryC1/StrS family aminotransferase n=1 Tax=Aliarcobacter butzleri TaxID=28197 RepID=UPI002B24FE6A|nr:DegT/DnrJ/EryC1/StrS family aminotransferase [Aliarcobacter butzleri]
MIKHLKLKPRLKPNYTFSDWLAIFNIFQKNPIKSYEKEFSQKFENNYGVMFQHGRTGLYALLKVWELENDEVICPAYTCVVVPNAIVLSGNVPVFVDSSKESFNMDLELLENAITEKTRAIVVTHIFGYPIDVVKVQKIVKNAEQKYGHKIYVIQDAAHSYGAKWQGELVTKYGDAAIFGSNISKIINSIFGGMVITNSKETFDKLKSWRTNNTKVLGFSKSIKRFIYFVAVNIAFNSYIYGFVNWLERIGALDRFVKYFEEDKIYFPTDWDIMPSNIEARVGRNQLKKYDYIIEKRVENAKNWMNKLQDKDCHFMQDIQGSTYSHCVALVENRGDWLEKYREDGIQLGILIEYSIPYMKAYESYKLAEYPVSLEYSKKSINFPNWV